MSSLTNPEKVRIEKILGMSSGYVLGFSNASFKRFFEDVVGKDIEDPIYSYASNSKANRLRKFWMIENDKTVGKLLGAIFQNWDIYRTSDSPLQVPNEVTNIVSRLTLKDNKPEEDQKNFLRSEEIATFKTKFYELNGLTPQERGFAFERFLNEFFRIHDLNPRSAFRLTGEQIDGSFMFGGNIYIVEAKWQDKPISEADLLILHGKLTGKAEWTRGLFISMSGFSKEGIEAYGRGKRCSMVGIDGQDLHFILEQKISFEEVLIRKLRAAAEEGRFYYPVLEMIY